MRGLRYIATTEEEEEEEEEAKNNRLSARTALLKSLRFYLDQATVALTHRHHHHHRRHHRHLPLSTIAVNHRYSTCRPMAKGVMGPEII